MWQQLLMSRHPAAEAGASPRKAPSPGSRATCSAALSCNRCAQQRQVCVSRWLVVPGFLCVLVRRRADGNTRSLRHGRRHRPHLPPADGGALKHARRRSRAGPPRGPMLRNYKSRAVLTRVYLSSTLKAKQRAKRGSKRACVGAGGNAPCGCVAAGPAPYLRYRLTLRVLHSAPES